jgi:hypothetical protein
MKALEIQATHHATLTTAQIDAAVKSAGDHLKATDCDHRRETEAARRRRQGEQGQCKQ